MRKRNVPPRCEESNYVHIELLFASFYNFFFNCFPRNVCFYKKYLESIHEISYLRNKEFLIVHSLEYYPVSQLHSRSIWNSVSIHSIYFFCSSHYFFECSLRGLDIHECERDFHSFFGYFLGYSTYFSLKCLCSRRVFRIRSFSLYDHLFFILKNTRPTRKIARLTLDLSGYKPHLSAETGFPTVDVTGS
jgi:hypothetical protein